MSHQELATTMATKEPEEDSPKSWFLRRFFTPEVKAYRESDLPELPLKNPEKCWESVTMKMDRKVVGKTTHVMLHVDPDRGTFHFKSHLWVNPLPVSEGILASAIDPGSDWVTIRLGTQTLPLNRAELKAAFLQLKSRIRRDKKKP